MRIPHYLVLSASGVYHFRLKVPAAAQAALGVRVLKQSLRTRDTRTAQIHPLLWAESVASDGTFAFKAEKKNHAPFFKIEKGDEWLLVTKPCVLVQRTTAKEQSKRLVAAGLPSRFIKKHGGVVVENHLNMVRPEGKPKVSPSVLAALLNSRALDQVFRCMNGSVAVSAFELEALPLPNPADLKMLSQLVKKRAARDELDAECNRLYGIGA